MRCLAGLALAGSLAAAPADLGLPVIHTFRAKDYGAPAQNWAFAEDPRGVMFIGNNAGVLEYDGAAWRLISTRNRSCVRSLGVAADGRVYVGAKNEFGYLEPDSGGQLRYVPLEDLVPAGARNFADVWSVLPTAEGVCFSTRDYLFRYDGRQVRVFKASTSFTMGWKVYGKVHLYERGVGPVRLEGDALRPLPGAERFSKEFVNFMVPWGGGDGILCGTSRQGLFLFDGAGFQPWPTDADDRFARMVLTHGALLPDGNLAVGGLQGGCLILDRQGRLLEHLDRKGGLLDDQVNRLYPDRHGRLWLAVNRGVAWVDWPAPVTAFSETSGLEGTLQSLVRHAGTLYAGTSRGLFLLARQEAAPGQAGPGAGPLWTWRLVDGIHGSTWHLLEARGRLLAANGLGIYEVAGGRARLLAATGADRDAFRLVPSRLDPARVYACLSTGVGMFRWEGARLRDEGRLPGVNAEVRTLVEDPDGSLWLGTQSSGVLRVRPRRNWRVDTLVERFGTAQGLPSPSHDFVRVLGGRMTVATHRGFYGFDPGRGRFEPDPRFAAVLPEGAWYPDGVAEDGAGRIWLSAMEDARGERRSGVAVPGPDGRYRMERGALARFSDFLAYTILPEPDGPVWLGGPEGLLRLEPALDRGLHGPAAPVVRRVLSAGGQVAWGGSGAWAGADAVPHSGNSLRFEFAAPDQDPAGLSYQVRLEGYDKAFSPWSAETVRDYTNLPEGRYRFLVRVRNAAGQAGPAAVLAFRVLPPFYRTWWAYGLYVAAAAGLGNLAVHWRLRRVMRARRLLARRVAERTDQLRRRTRQLEQAKAEAEAATRAKSEFLANMSHEIRTPLNAILGYSEILRDEVAEPRHRDHLAAITSGGQALLGVIGDILDLSKIEAGKLELEPAPIDLDGLVRDVVRTFALRCREKGLELRVDADPALPRALMVSPVHLRQILFNLVGNAVKFTAQGTVRVVLGLAGRGPDCVDVALRVEDTGIGIAADQLATIFEAFQQAKGQDPSRYGGTGLGLAICRRLAAAMGGDLRVASTPGQGSCFTLLLPGVPVASGEPEPARDERPFQGRFRPATLLVADDLQPNRNLLRHYFEGVPFRFLEAADGQAALDLARANRPDLVLMDLRMPRMDGLEATRRFKADPALKDIPVLVLTASTTLADEGPVWASGADGFLRKPVSRVRLAAELSRFLPYDLPADAAEEPAEAPPPEPVRQALPDLLAELEGEVLPEWTRLQDAFFIDRMAALAARVQEAAERHQEPGLLAWATQVQAQARAFDMENLPATFKRFPEALARLRRWCPGPVG